MIHVSRRSLLAMMLSALTLWPGGCSSPTHPRVEKTGREPTVRVRIYEAQTQVTLTAAQPPSVSVGGQAARLLNVPPGVAVTAQLDRSGSWQIGSANLGGGVLTIRPASEGSVAINGEPFRGSFRLVPLGQGRFDVVNDIDVDDYLRAVLPRELPKDWHPEAYCAQAIVARTYAIYEARTSPKAAHYDLHADVRSQVYGGLRAESEKSRLAVERTAGIVVAFGRPGQERIFKAYFSSCCGGVSQSAWDAFGDDFTEPLSEQSAGSMCSISPKYNWGPIVVTKDELTRRFRAWGARQNRPEQQMAQLVSVRVSGVNRYGRSVRFEVTDAAGNRFTWRGEQLRWAVNTDAQTGTTLMSSFCKVVDAGVSIQFVEGHGWGHAVGLCQWCTQARALAGWAHEDIVIRSYPGSRLVRAY
jgi:stage II sporulation protein D